MYDRLRRDEAGFTLIELLIVIIVLGILAAVTVFGLSNISGQSLTQACHADAKSVAVAQEAIKTVTGSYAPDVATLVNNASGGGPFLRSAPGNQTKYLITTVNGTSAGTGQTAGHVYVQKAGTVASAATVIDAEDMTKWPNYSAAGGTTVPGTDPCAGL